MTKKPTEPLSIKLPISQFRLLREFAIQHKHSSASSLMRSLLEQYLTQWRKAPYVCRRSTHFVFFDRNGSLFYLPRDTIEANRRLSDIRAHLRAKLEVVAHDDDGHQLGWGFSRFRLVSMDGSVIAEQPGVGEFARMSAMFNSPLETGECVVRDGLFAVERYAKCSFTKKRTEESLYDHVDFFIDNPTYDFSATLVLDANLFGSAPALEISGQLINSDEVRFSRALSELENSFFPPITGCPTNPLRIHPPGRVIWADHGSKDGDGNLRSVMESARRDFELIKDQMKQADLRFDTPTEVFVYHLRGFLPPTGLGLSIAWRLPG